MLALRNPQRAYHQVDFHARVHGANPGQLVDLCLEQVGMSIGRALFADTMGDNVLKSASIARATAALTSLILGIDPASPISGALRQMYQAARHTVLDSVTQFDRRALTNVRTDFNDIRLALLRSSTASAPTAGDSPPLPRN